MDRVRPTCNYADCSINVVEENAQCGDSPQRINIIQLYSFKRILCIGVGFNFRIFCRMYL